ncbi:hypothetical protein D3C84_287910 [compost metagenome]
MPSLIRKFLPRTASTALAIALFTFGLMNDTHAAACPTEHFDDFAKLFEDQAETRHTYIQQPLTLQRAVVQDNQVSVISNKAQDPTREVEKVFALQKSNDLKVEVKFPDRVTLRDSNGEFLIVLLFEQKNCWELSKIEDWSLGQQLSAGNASDPAAIAVKRGNLYDRLAAETQSNSLIALYASALDSYLHGASLGSARAAYLAAGISLSGQAPRLHNSLIKSLLETASRSEPEAGLTLAGFYCDEGEPGDNRPCVNPEKSLEALQDAARQGLSAALVELGSAYAAGEITERDPLRALACYQEAKVMGVQGLQPSIEALRATGVEPSNTVHCL